MRTRWRHAVLVLLLVFASRSEPPVHASQARHAEYRAPSDHPPVTASKRVALRPLDARRSASSSSPAPELSRFALTDPSRTCVLSRPEPAATTAAVALLPVHDARGPPRA